MLQTKQAALSPGSDDGTFTAILSTPSVDRDGESLASHQWKQPLPKSIAITVDHTGSVADVVASGEPYMASDGSLRLNGRFASTEKGQQIRQLVVGGHINALSIEMLRHKAAANGEPMNELVGASFVLLPANTDAVVLSAKAFNDQLEQVIKAASAGEDVSAMVRAIHDASVNLGAQCVAYVSDVNPDGSLDDDSMSGESGADDGANKCAALSLRVKALSR
jgi:hypothetical protein